MLFKVAMAKQQGKIVYHTHNFINS